jgi:hypothetical protein
LVLSNLLVGRVAGSFIAFLVIGHRMISGEPQLAAAPPPGTVPSGGGAAPNATPSSANVGRTFGRNAKHGAKLPDPGVSGAGRTPPLITWVTTAASARIAKHGVSPSVSSSHAVTPNDHTSWGHARSTVSVGSACVAHGYHLLHLQIFGITTHAESLWGVGLGEGRRPRTCGSQCKHSPGSHAGIRLC